MAYTKAATDDPDASRNEALVLEEASALYKVSAAERDAQRLKALAIQIGELRKRHDTPEIALMEARVLCNASAVEPNAVERQRLASRIGELRRHDTAEIALEQVGALFNAAAFEPDVLRRKRLADEIGRVRKRHDTPEIALMEARVLCGATSPQDGKKIFFDQSLDLRWREDRADEIGELRKKHDVAEIALLQLKALYNATVGDPDAKRCGELADRIGGLRRAHDSAEARLTLAKALQNASLVEKDAWQCKAFADQVEELRMVHDTAEIAVIQTDVLERAKGQIKQQSLEIDTAVGQIVTRCGGVKGLEKHEPPLVRLMHWGISVHIKWRVAKALLDLGADVNAPDALVGGRDTALHHAVRDIKDCGALLKVLLDGGADLNARNAKGETPLHKVGHEKIARMLLAYGADVDARNVDGYTPLHFAMWQEAGVSIAKTLLDHGADVNARTAHGSAPLHLAVDNLHNRERALELAELLLARGAEVNAGIECGCTALFSAMTPALEDLLRRHGAVIDIFAAAKLDLPDAAQELLRTNPTLVRSANRWQVSPLHAARGRVTQVLLTSGADVNSKDGYGRTPLHLAARDRDMGRMITLLNAGADINAKDNGGETPLHFASNVPPQYSNDREGEMRMAKLASLVRLLLDRGADVNADGELGSTLLRKAGQYGTNEVYYLLEAKIRSLPKKKAQP